MEAKGLQEGNLIQDIKYKSPWRIICFLGSAMATVDAGLVNFPTDDQHDVDLSECEAIPFAKEWPERFGFEKIENDFKEDFKCIYWNKGIRVALCIDSMWRYFPETLFGFSIDIEYVHRFQNIHYDLTGEELKVND